MDARCWARQRRAQARSALWVRRIAPDTLGQHFRNSGRSDSAGPRRIRRRGPRGQERRDDGRRIGAAATAYHSIIRPEPLDRIPVRKRDELTFVPVDQIASIVAEGELLHLFTIKNGRQTITYRLKDL